jgi:predicted 3-demethylubiquinone-9 3-methyltransferase (glyoxalase superfamily)
MKVRIYPCLWFDRQAEEAAKFYCSIFPNSKIEAISHYGEGNARYDADGNEVPSMPNGSVLAVQFTLDGNEVMALNGGPLFTFSEAISLVVSCDTQKEIDHYWKALTAGGGQAVQCGWLKDKYGLSWQVVPNAMDRMIGDKDPVRAARVMKVVMQSVKLDVEKIQKAYEGKTA